MHKMYAQALYRPNEKAPQTLRFEGQMGLPTGVSLNSALPRGGTIRAVSQGRCSRSQQPIAAIREQNREQLWAGRLSYRTCPLALLGG